MKKSLILALALVSATSYAANNTFKFRVFSSGADIFPCNAGIMHSSSASAGGYIVDTQNPDYNGYGSEIVDSVTNSSSEGSYVPDLMSYNVVAVDEWTGNQQLIINDKKFASGAWNSIFSGNNYLDLRYASSINLGIHKENDMNSVISSLDFILSSENFGTSYFVDVCYYAPQFAPTLTNGQVYSFTSKVSYTDLVSGRDYLANAGVKAQVEMYCDGQQVKKANYQQVLSSSEKVFFNKEVFVHNGQYSPEKCVVRYTFTESAKTRRQHAAHGGQFTLFTDITDPAAE